MSTDRDFTTILADLDDGRVHAQLTAELLALGRAVAATNKKGSITLKITLTPGAGTVAASATVASSLPKAALDATRFFLEEESGELHREDPRQTTLPLKRVEAPAPTPLRHIDGGAK